MFEYPAEKGIWKIRRLEINKFRSFVAAFRIVEFSGFLPNSAPLRLSSDHTVMIY